MQSFLFEHESSCDNVLKAVGGGLGHTVLP